MDKRSASIPRTAAGKCKSPIGSDETQESYRRAKEHFYKESPSQEEFDEYREYLLADERNWDGVERLFDEVVTEDEEFSTESWISFICFLKRNRDFRRSWKIDWLKKTLIEEEAEEENMKQTQNFGNECLIGKVYE